MQSAGLEGSSSLSFGTDRRGESVKSFKDRASMSEKKVQEVSEAAVAKINEHVRKGCQHCIELVRSLDVEPDEKR